MKFLILHEKLSREYIRETILKSPNKAFWQLVRSAHKEACAGFVTVIKPLGLELDGVPLHIALKPCLPSFPAHADLYMQTSHTGVGEVELSAC